MIMGVAVKIAGMALGASTASAAVDGGIAMAAGPYDPRSIGVGVTEVAVVVMDGAYPITNVAVDAKRGIGNGCRMIMAVSWRIRTWYSGEEVGTMADDTGRIWCDRNNQRTIDGVLQARRCGVAIAALVFVDGHWVVGWMATYAERRVTDMVESCSRVVDVQVSARRGLVLMAVQAVDDGLVGIGDDLSDCGAGCCYRIDVPGGVVTRGAVDVQSKDLCKVSKGMAVGAGLRVCLT